MSGAARAYDSALKITLGAGGWQDDGSEEMPKSRLYRGLVINSQRFNVEAYQVHDVPTSTGDGQTIQNPVDDTFMELWDQLTLAMDCEFTTQQIEGREYAIFITPYGR